MSIPVFEDLWPEVIERLGILGALKTIPTREKILKLFSSLPALGGEFGRHVERWGVRISEVFNVWGPMVRTNYENEFWHGRIPLITAVFYTPLTTGVKRLIAINRYTSKKETACSIRSPILRKLSRRFLVAVFCIQS